MKYLQCTINVTWLWCLRRSSSCHTVPGSLGCNASMPTRWDGERHVALGCQLFIYIIFTWVDHRQLKLQNMKPLWDNYCTMSRQREPKGQWGCGPAVHRDPWKWGKGTDTAAFSTSLNPQPRATILAQKSQEEQGIRGPCYYCWAGGHHWHQFNILTEASL